MKMRLLILSLMATSVTYAMNGPLQGTSYLSPRSQSVNAARELVGWYRFINLYDQDCLYGAATATPSGGHSFRPERIAQYFFNTDQLVISGSQVANRQSNQILADYFGLSPLYQSTVCMTPKIATFLVDFDGYVGYRKFYIRAHAPAVWTRYSMNLKETVVASGSETPYPALYMDAGPISAPAPTWSAAMAGNYTYGQVTEGIEFGKIICSKSAAALSEIQVAVGYNIVSKPHGHAGFNIRGSIPTGTRPNGKLLFQPIVGNGHHGELGVGFTGHILLWEKDTNQTLGLYIDINATHLFGSRQIRSFDLSPNGFGSRYILTKIFDQSGNYSGQTVPLINRTTLPCNVSAALQLDAAIMFGFIHNCWSFDIGYDAWLRTAEHVSLCGGLPVNQLGLKGIQNTNTLLGLSNETQSGALIYGNSFVNQAAVADPISPVFIATQNINADSAAAPRNFTNKIFGHISYVISCDHNFDPFIGAGGEVEFEGLNPRTTTERNNNSVSQWALWIKGGIGF